MISMRIKDGSTSALITTLQSLPSKVSGNGGNILEAKHTRHEHNSLLLPIAAVATVHELDSGKENYKFSRMKQESPVQSYISRQARANGTKLNIDSSVSSA